MKFLYNFFKKKALKYEIKRMEKISDCRVEKKGTLALRIPTLFSGKGSVILGDGCVFGFPSSLFFNAYNHIEARNETSVIKIGDGTIFNNNTSIVSNGAVISIGKNCCIGLNFQCYDSDFHGISIEDRHNEKATISKNTTIGDDCFIGNNVIILKGAHIGNRCVVAAGSVVTSSTPCADDTIIAGNPAKIIKRIEQNKHDYPAVLSPLTFSKKGDEKGWLIAFENSHNIPFDVKRVYWSENRENTQESKAVYKTVGDSLFINANNNHHPDFGNYADLLKGNYLPNGFLCLRQAIIDAGKYNPNVFLEDWYMNLQLSKQGKFKYIPEILYSYRWHGNNTLSSPEYQKKTLEIYRQIYEHEKEYCFAHGYKKQWKRQWCKRFGWRAKWKKLRDTIRGKK